jgi:hypothetical protein
MLWTCLCSLEWRGKHTASLYEQTQVKIPIIRFYFIHGIQDVHLPTSGLCFNLPTLVHLFKELRRIR